MKEIWMPVPGFGGHYEASSFGRIKALERSVVKRHRTGKNITQRYAERILSPSPSGPLGYLQVSLGVDGRKFTQSVHRLVLLAFRGEPAAGHEACHGNGIPHDNRIENLRWDTHKNNNGDRKLHGRYASGEHHPMSKWSNEDRKFIASLHVSEAVAHGMSRTHYFRTRKEFGLPVAPRRFARGELHGISKLNDRAVMEIRELVKMGETQRAIASRFGVAQGAIGDIVRGITWKHLPSP